MASSRLCAVLGCGKPHHSRGFCGKHAYRFLKHGDPLGGGIFRTRVGPTCQADGCDKSTKGGGRGFCATHYQRFMKHGDPHKGALVKGVCSIPDCGKPNASHDLCAAHLARLKRHGDPLYGGPLKRRAKLGEPLAWLFAHVDHEGQDCLIWPFGRD